MKKLFTIALTTLACAGPTPPSPEREAARQAEDTVAIFDGGRISSQQVDQAILALPPAQRDTYRGSELDSYRSMVRNLATDELLRSAAESSGFSQSSEYTAELEEMRRQVLVQQCLIDSPPPVEVPSEEEVRQHFEQTKAARGEAEQRFVLTIFKRHRQGRDRAQLEAELNTLRQRVFDGESFEVLAREESDSEARHLSGAIGWVSPGQFGTDLDEVIFALPEETPSEPIVTSAGGHLFYIATELGRSTPKYEAVAEPIRQSLLRQRQLNALQDLVASTELPPGSRVPNREELADLLQQEDHDTELLRIGKFSLTLGRLRNKVAEEESRADGEPLSSGRRSLAIFNAIKQREVLFHRFHGMGQTLRPEIQQRFERQADVFLVQRFGEEQLERRLDELEPELIGFHQRHQKRFATLLELRLEALVVAHGDQPSSTMELLESQAEALAAGTVTLQGLADELGGEIQVSEWVDINSLTAFRAKAAFFVPGIAAGGFSPPYNTGHAIELFRVLERREPRSLAYADARRQVRDAYLERHGQELYDVQINALLQQAHFEILEERLVDLASGGLRVNATPTETSSTDEASTDSAVREAREPQG